MVRTRIIRRLGPSLLFLAALALSACRARPTEEASQTEATTPDISICMDQPERTVATTGITTQDNCALKSSASYTYTRSRSISHTIEVGAGFEVDARGEVSIAGTGVELGAKVASQMGQSYAEVDTLSRSLTLSTPPEKCVEYHINFIEVWQVGTAKVAVGQQNYDIPFRYRSDFDLELAGSSHELLCPTPTLAQGAAPTSTASSTATTVPTDTPSPVATPTPTATTPPTAPSDDGPLLAVTLQSGTGFIFVSQKITSGTGVDRDMWWNGVGLVPNKRMYSLGAVSSLRDIVQIATGEFGFGEFPPSDGEGFAIEVNRQSPREYAIVRVLSVESFGDISLEWLYPYTGEVTGPQ